MMVDSQIDMGTVTTNSMYMLMKGQSHLDHFSFGKYQSSSFLMLNQFQK